METNTIAVPKKYSVWKAMFLSLFSGELYRDVGRNWKGTGFGYMFLILLLGWIPVAGKMHMDISKSIQEHSGDVFKNLPDFKIQNGKFSIKVKQPYFVPDKKNPTIIIDTTGQIKSLSQVPGADKQPSVMLITQDKMIVHRVRLGIPDDQTTQFSDFGPMTVSKDTLVKALDLFRRLSGFLIYPFAVAGHFIWNLIAILVYALVGLLVAVMMKVSLKYEALMRLAAVSHTPALLLAMVLFFINVDIPYSFPLYFLFSTVYLSVAIWANKSVPPAVPGVISS